MGLETGWVRKRWLPAPRAGDGNCKTMHIGRNGWDSDSYPWIGRSISMKKSTADCETSFYIRLKAPLFVRRCLRPECLRRIPYGAAALQGRVVRGPTGYPGTQNVQPRTRWYSV